MTEVKEKKTAKSSKCQMVLILFESLKTGGVEMQEFCTDFGVSIPTFKRYIQEIRCFLFNSYLPLELVYSKKEKKYEIIEVHVDINE